MTVLCCGLLEKNKTIRKIKANTATSGSRVHCKRSASNPKTDFRVLCEYILLQCQNVYIMHEKMGGGEEKPQKGNFSFKKFLLSKRKIKTKYTVHKSIIIIAIPNQKRNQ